MFVLLFVAIFTGGAANINLISLVNFTGHSTSEGPAGKIYIICETALSADCDELSWEPRRDNAAYIENCKPKTPPSKKTVRFEAMDMAEYHTCNNVTIHMLNTSNLLVKDVYWEGETVQCIDYNDTDSAYTHTNLREDLSTFDVTLSVTYSEIGILDLYLSLKDVVIEGETMCNKTLITPHAVPVLDIRFEDNKVVCNASQLVEGSVPGLVCTILMFKDKRMVAKTPKNDTSNTLSSPFTKSSLAGFQCEANCRINGIDGEIADPGKIIVTKVISVNKVIFWVLIGWGILILIAAIVLCVFWWRKWGHKMRYWNWRSCSFYAPMPTDPANVEEIEDEQTATRAI